MQDTKALAQKLNISWGKLVTLALNDFVRRHNRPQRLTEQINAAYTDNLDSHEMAVLRGMASTHRRLVENEW
ncbi:MAG: hypothetical protein F6K30_24250 [Cyanothece sp. SIO2G6]|nr:hypothetical protein [Cyanothece sp. SIO2G6]